MAKIYEIRDPVHGFVELNDWEREIINHPVFQRLRRIRQLAWTDMVYPGAMHTRFEHSLGVMHVATQLFDQITHRRRNFLESELNFDDAGLRKDRILVRLAALLHDLGHAPFSHAAEDVMPLNPNTGEKYKHEQYSAAAAYLMRDVIEDHPYNQNYEIKVEDIDKLYSGQALTGRRLLWRDLVSSQLDADRADYLLRDAHHIGVEYGRYDLNRLLTTITVGIDTQTDSPSLAIEVGGIHTAESLLIARYMMFTQVYFQHTRRAYDHHIVGAINSILKSKQNGVGTFPPPTPEGIEEYLKWTDWRVLGCISDDLGGKDGQILQERKHYRSVYEIQEVPQERDIEFVEALYKELCERIGEEQVFVDKAVGSWYKPSTDVKILKKSAAGKDELIPLSQLSSVVRGLATVNQIRVYVALSEVETAKQILRSFTN